ncbi:MAG: hypothetical protein KF901_08405 [Myxococcales bacterium]|nr:hypothetical protein [Myxococcales bacterium]
MGEWTPLALLALLSIIPLAAYVTWSKRPQIAALYVVFFGTLFGPEGAFIKLPMVPPLDKNNIPYVVLFAIAIVRWRAALRRAKAWRGIDLLVVVAIIAGFVTWQTNTDALRYGSWRVTMIPGLQFNDGFQYGFVALLSYGIPFVLGRALFRTRRDLLDLLHFLVIAGFVQTALLLVEIRMSPQWHVWVYGYGAHSDFLQTMRWGGFRPMNFMAHGLALALFMTAVLLAAITLAKLGEPIRKWSAKRVSWVLFVVLILCKSTGAILYAVVFGPLLARGSHKLQARVVMAIALFVAIYPALRAFDLFPAEALVEQAQAAFGEERAQSLEFRFDNEKLLLDKARERLWFGWGGMGRNSVYDDEMGKEITIADGHWIIVLGLHGVIGMITCFGFLLVPLFVLRRRVLAFPYERDRTLLLGFGLICAMLTLDLVPNGLWATYPFLFAGGLLGALQEARRADGAWSLPPAEATRARRRARA